MKWIKIGDSAKDGYVRRTFAAEIPEVGCLILINSEDNGGRVVEHSTFIPDVQVKDAELVPIKSVYSI